jgi:hypothetical protein
LVTEVSTGDAVSIANHVVGSTKVYKALEEVLIQNCADTERGMGNKKLGFVSSLMHKDYDSLQDFSWDTVVGEAFTKFPLLMKMMTGIMLPKEKLVDVLAVKDSLPRLGMVYSILLQGRRHELSAVQRIMSMNLFENICDQKVFIN